MATIGRKQRLSQKSGTVAEFGHSRRCLAVFGDSRTFLRQCGQGFISRRFSSIAIPYVVRSTIGLLSDSYTLLCFISWYHNHLPSIA